MNCALCKQPIYEDQRTVGYTHYACEAQLTASWRADLDSVTAQRDELLAALKRAAEVLDAEGIVYGNSDDEPLDVLSAARAIIAKTEGVATR